jgi:hypothetical protein
MRQYEQRRFTSAHAEKIQAENLPPFEITVHLRVCGENV